MTGTEPNLHEVVPFAAGATAPGRPGEPRARGRAQRSSPRTTAPATLPDPAAGSRSDAELAAEIVAGIGPKYRPA